MVRGRRMSFLRACNKIDKQCVTLMSFSWRTMYVGKSPTEKRAGKLARAAPRGAPRGAPLAAPLAAPLLPQGLFDRFEDSDSEHLIIRPRWGWDLAPLEEFSALDASPSQACPLSPQPSSPYLDNMW